MCSASERRRAELPHLEASLEDKLAQLSLLQGSNASLRLRTRVLEDLVTHTELLLLFIARNQAAQGAECESGGGGGGDNAANATSGSSSSRVNFEGCGSLCSSGPVSLVAEEMLRDGHIAARVRSSDAQQRVEAYRKILTEFGVLLPQFSWGYPGDEGDAASDPLAAAGGAADDSDASAGSPVPQGAAPALSERRGSSECSGTVLPPSARAVAARREPEAAAAARRRVRHVARQFLKTCFASWLLNTAEQARATSINYATGRHEPQVPASWDWDAVLERVRLWPSQLEYLAVLELITRQRLSKCEQLCAAALSELQAVQQHKEGCMESEDNPCAACGGHVRWHSAANSTSSNGHAADALGVDAAEAKLAAALHQLVFFSIVNVSVMTQVLLPEQLASMATACFPYVPTWRCILDAAARRWAAQHGHAQAQQQPPL